MTTTGAGITLGYGMTHGYGMVDLDITIGAGVVALAGIVDLDIITGAVDLVGASVGVVFTVGIWIIGAGEAMAGIDLGMATTTIITGHMVIIVEEEGTTMATILSEI
jgi:hypothetical protein